MNPKKTQRTSKKKAAKKKARGAPKN